MLTRRRFLKAGLLGGALLGGAFAIGRQFSGYALDAATRRRLRVLSPKELIVLQAAARRIVAPDGDAPSTDAVGVGLAVDAYLEKLPAAMVKDVRALLHLLEHGAVVFRLSGTRFSKMTPDEQDRTLADWQGSSLALRRRGFQALRALAFFGYYRDARTWPLLGYSGPMLPKPT